LQLGKAAVKSIVGHQFIVGAFNKHKGKTIGVKIDLVFNSIKPRVLQGEEGLSQKGEQPGNASYYYSYTRMKTTGNIILNEE
jgi:predicted secreted hydrolase